MPWMYMLANPHAFMLNQFEGPKKLKKRWGSTIMLFGYYDKMLLNEILYAHFLFTSPFILHLQNIA